VEKEKKRKKRERYLEPRAGGVADANETFGGRKVNPPRQPASPPPPRLTGGW